MDKLKRLLDPHKGLLRGLHGGDRGRTLPVTVEELMDATELLKELQELRQKCQKETATSDENEQ